MTDSNAEINSQEQPRVKPEKRQPLTPEEIEARTKASQEQLQQEKEERDRILAEYQAESDKRDAKARVNMGSTLAELIQDEADGLGGIEALMQPGNINIQDINGRKVGPGFQRTQIVEKGSLGGGTPSNPLKIGKK